MAPRRLRRLPARRLERGATVHEATTFRSRLLGLALLRGLPPGHALAIPHCRSVHTFGMRFPIDVVFLDAAGNVLRIDRSVPRRRLLRCSRAFAVLETRAGEAQAFLHPRSEISRLNPRAAPGGASEP
jgi:uncharacterized membrane protein (UPF0127 family)